MQNPAPYARDFAWDDPVHTQFHRWNLVSAGIVVLVVLLPGEGAVLLIDVRLRQALLGRDGQYPVLERVSAGIFRLGGRCGNRVHRPVGTHPHGGMRGQITLPEDQHFLVGEEVQRVMDGHRAGIGDEHLLDSRPAGALQDGILAQDATR